MDSITTNGTVYRHRNPRTRDGPVEIRPKGNGYNWKLTSHLDDVLTALSRGESQASIAKRYGVHESAIYRINRKRKSL